MPRGFEVVADGEIRNRMYLAIDFDAFYCGVEEKYDPRLKGEPFIVAQKNCIATLSYAARELGLKKLGLVSEAKKTHPDVKHINGEDLSRYRKEGKYLWKFIKEKVDGCPVERLGLEEMWIDLTPTLDTNYETLGELGFFEFIDNLENADYEPLDGVDLSLSPDPDSPPVYCENFSFELPTKVYPEAIGTKIEDVASNEGYLRAYVAGHLAYQLHEIIFQDTGYSCSIGVARNKTLSKMVGSLNKPNGVTVLYPGFEGEYLKELLVSKIPYFGAKSVEKVKAIMEVIDTPTVEDVLKHFDTEETFLAKVGNTDKERHLWKLLHGDDDGQVIDSPEFPSQISNEDSLKRGVVTNLDQMAKRLQPIVLALFDQILTDIVDTELARWLAYPTTLRLQYSLHDAISRKSSSTKLPAKFETLAKLTTPQDQSKREQLAQNLIHSDILELFKRPNSTSWSVVLLNVAVEGIQNLDL